MKELNNVEKKEIRIKQDRLRVLLNIDSLVSDVASPDVCVDTDSIVDYTSHEKNSLVIDIINSLDIREYDTSFLENNGASGYTVNCTIEQSLSHINNTQKFPIVETIYNELVIAIANYDIDDLVGFEIISIYLKLIGLSADCYEDLTALEDCKRIN